MREESMWTTHSCGIHNFQERVFSHRFHELCRCTFVLNNVRAHRSLSHFQLLFSCSSTWCWKSKVLIIISSKLGILQLPLATLETHEYCIYCVLDLQWHHFIHTHTLYGTHVTSQTDDIVLWMYPRIEVSFNVRRLIKKSSLTLSLRLAVSKTFLCKFE